MKLPNIRNISPKRMLLSGSIVAVALAVVIGATGAFFSDEETSTGNIFTAGAIDLKIDNESYAIDCNIPELESCEGVLAFSPGTSWELDDLDDHLFFNFFDLKPGDYGEDTISIHVDNDAWLCMDWTITDRDENELLEPEEEDGDVTEDEGELQNFINFVWWVDDGDNVLEEGEEESAIFSGTLEEMDGLAVALADSSDESVSDGPIPGGDIEDEESIFYIGKAWCFGELTLDPFPQDSDEGPLDRGTGILCDGSEVDNTPQTDSVVGDMTFRAVQSRNNPDFTCGEVPTTTSLTLVKEVIDIPEQDPDEDPSAWDLSASGPTPFSGPGPSVSSEVDPGTYDLSESPEIDGYVASAWVCVGGTQDDDDTVTLEEGDDVTCTITNREEQQETTGLLTLLKVVEDTDQIDDDPENTEWTLFADGLDLISGADGDPSVTGAVVTAGDYDLSESDIAGYDLTDIECIGNGGVLVLVGDTVTVAAGDDVTCTFTNTEELEGPPLDLQ